MAGILFVVIFLDKASIHTFLALAINLVHLVLLGGVRTPSYHRPFKLWFEFEVHLDRFVTRQELSPCNLHPLLEGADTKNGNRRNYFFLTFAARMNQTSPNKLCFTQFAAFLKTFFAKKNHYFD